MKISKHKRLIAELPKMPPHILAKDMFCIDEYVEKVNKRDKSDITSGAIHMRIKRVVEGTQDWDGWRAYRKGHGVFIVEIKTNKNKKTQPNGNKSKTTHPRQDHRRDERHQSNR